MAEISKEEVIGFIENMTLLEMSEFVKELEDKFGVTAAAPMAAMPAAAIGGAEEAPVEQTEFAVVLSGPGDRKIQVIKAVRAITGLGLKESKAVVDEAPTAVKEGISKEEADAIKEQLEEAGALVEVK